MNKTKIEWCDYSWNPLKGYCPNSCEYCYAHRMYERFGWDKTIRLDRKELNAPGLKEKPGRIFVGSMIDMYHPDINKWWVESIIEQTFLFFWHTYITLTKFPENLCFYDFPDNWWVGVTVDNGQAERVNILRAAIGISGNRFVSFEPLLSDMSHIDLDGIDWVIIGGLTPRAVHEKAWIDQIIEKAKALKIPVFIKKNANFHQKMQEFPIKGEAI